MSALTEAQKRKIHLPYVRAATNCISQSLLMAPDAVRLAKQGQWADALRALPKGQCGAEISTLIGTHDQLYGAGTGQTFFAGPYINDLPRALGNRLKGEFERLAAVEAREIAARQQEVARQEAAKRARIEEADRVVTLYRDKMYECTTNQIVKLAASSEGAEVLATAAMTICDDEIANAVRAGTAKLRIQFPDAETAPLRADFEAVIKKNVVTSAVQAKAALNVPRQQAASEPPPAPVTPVVATPPQVSTAPVNAGPAPAASPVRECLRTMAKAREGKFVNRDDLVKAMLDLCRPEIEGAARSAFLKDDKASLEQTRDKTLQEALREAREVVGSAN
ncbi:hypothetical protein [Methylorubrum populi]|uniref:hypothetical protein n=1 Tax=Methylorubrum populi TaxID=223967 RepID=UPI001264D77D|nr:hypothetical protein [Methylorubrum populi]